MIITPEVSFALSFIATHMMQDYFSQVKIALKVNITGRLKWLLAQVLMEEILNVHRSNTETVS